MAKKHYYIIAATIISLATIYSISWLLFANYLEKKLSNIFLKNNDFLLSYEKIEKYGFPFHVGFEISHPKFNINYGSILVMLSQNPQYNTTSAEKFMEDLNWKNELSIDGKLYVKTNLSTKNLFLKIVGDLNFKNIMDKEENNITFQSRSSGMQFGFDKGLMFLLDSNKDEQLTKVIKSLRLAKIEEKDSVVLNGDTKEILAKSEAKNIYFTYNENNNTSGHFSIQIKGINYEFTEAFDQMLASFLSSNFTKSEPVDLLFDSFPEHPSRGGKHNLDVDIIYTGTIDKDTLQEGNIDSSLDIKKLELNNEITSKTLSGHFDINMQKHEVVVLNALLDGGARFDEKWYNYMIDDAEEIVERLGNAQDAEIAPNIPDDTSSIPEIEESKNHQRDIYIANTIFKNFDVLMPRMHKFGNIQYGADITYDGNKSELHINRLNLKTDLYGLTIKGNVYKSTNTGEANITLTNYRNAVEDIYVYYQNISPIFDEVLEKPLPIQFQPEADKAIEELLLQLSDNPGSTSSDLFATVSFPQNAQPKIGTHDMVETMNIVMSSLHTKILQNETNTGMNIEPETDEESVSPAPTTN